LILERFNDAAKRGVYSLQEFFVLAGKALGFIFVKPFYASDLFQQMDAIGVGSLGIVLLTVVLVRAFGAEFSAEHHDTVTAAAIFWQFANVAGLVAFGVLFAHP